MNPPTPLVTVLVPVFNEALAVEQELTVIREAFAGVDYAWELLVVDDASTDGSGELAERLGAVVVRHVHNKGSGGARTTGVRYARGEIVVMTDADGTYPNRQMPTLVEAVRAGYDMAVGARNQERGTLRLLRTPAKEFIRRLASFMVGSPIPDLNSGMRAVRTDVALRFVGILPNTHSWVSTITLALLANGFRVFYLPVDYFPRIGKSSFHPIRDSYNYLSLVFRALTYFNPLKIFLPVSLVVFLFGLVKMLYDNFRHSDIRESDIMIVLVGVLITMLGMLADLVVAQNRHRFLAPPRLAKPPTDGRDLVH